MTTNEQSTVHPAYKLALACFVEHVNPEDFMMLSLEARVEFARSNGLSVEDLHEAQKMIAQREGAKQRSRAYPWARQHTDHVPQ